MPKSNPAPARYEDWIRTAENAPSLEEQILTILRERSREAFEKGDLSLGAQPQEIANIVGGSRGRISQRLDLMKAEGLVTGVRDTNNARLVRWFVSSHSGINPTKGVG